MVLGLVAMPPRAIAADAYELGPESLGRAAGVPAGRVESFEFNDSKVYPGTQRAGWVYVPAQYDGATPAALMVFQDGHSYVGTNGALRATVVMDNLIAAGDMPVTIGVFINPGHRGDGAPPAEGWGNRSNRAVEYDSLGDAYVKFLTEELLPFVAARWNLKISADPKLRAISGQSSGGI
ncbi:MAG: esterase family protein, partial [Verrucomicrobiales bacterium]|nr:esterase family protein [Verrucomicrobiales bacterium]